MKKKTNARLIVAAVSMLVAGSLVTSDAMAHKRHKRHSHKRHHATRTHSSGSYSSYSSSSETNSKVDALEAQMRAMQDELSALRANGSPAAGSADAAKVQELDAWMQDAKSKPARPKDNMVFFRGAFARNDQAPIATTSNGTCAAGAGGKGVGCTSSDKDGWSFGAGFDFSLDDNLFGMMDNTEVLAELMFDYNEFGTFKSTVTGGQVNNTTESFLRLTAAPKIKFMKGSKLRPWIIPAGFTLNVLSPPAQLQAISHLMPAMHFGGGVDYNIWKNIYVGADVRYNWAFNKLDSSTNVNGFTAGGYLGIGF
jgi:opacity protein-like surface antigen